MSEKTRVVFAIPSLRAGGMERVMVELADYFSRKEYIDLHIILYSIRRDIFYPLPQNITIHKPSFGSIDSGSRTINIIRNFFYLRKTVSRLQPQVVLSFGEYWNNFLLLSLLWKKIPIYVSDRCRPDKYLGRVHEFLRKWLYPKAAGIIVQTVTAKSIYQKNIRNKNIEVIGNPVRAINNNGSNPKQNVVLNVSRLIPTKHHDKLIKLFATIDLPGWKLVIVGDDIPNQNNLKKLRQLAKDMNVADRVILTGGQQNVEDYYNSSKIFAFTSSSEGFPNVVGEALAAGLPVVSFDCMSGPSEMITDGKNGFLVPLFDYVFFKEKLQLLMNDEELINKLGAEGKLSINKFSIDKIGAAFENFILKERA